MIEAERCGGTSKPSAAARAAMASVRSRSVPMIFGNRIERNNLGRIVASVPTWHYPFILVLLVTIGVGLYQRVAQRNEYGGDGDAAGAIPPEETTA